MRNTWNRKWLWLVSVISIAVAVVATDYWRRCHGPTLTKVEAVDRAQKQLTRFLTSHHVHEATFSVVDAQFESDTNSWLITYKSSTCSVIVITDRCHGDEIGAASECR